MHSSLCEELKHFSCICLHHYLAFWTLSRHDMCSNALLLCALWMKRLQETSGKHGFQQKKTCVAALTSMAGRAGIHGLTKCQPTSWALPMACLSVIAAGSLQGKQPHFQQSPCFLPCSCHNSPGTDARSKLSCTSSSSVLLSGCWMGEESGPCVGWALPAFSKRPFSAP